MAKKGSKWSLFYFIGMALVAVGFCCPMFKGKLLGGTSNGFDYINFQNFDFVSLGAILILVGAILGLVFCSVKIKNLNFLKLLAVVLSIVGGIVLIIGFNDNAVYKAVAKGFLKHAYIGFYMILAGWILGIVGWVTKK